MPLIVDPALPAASIIKEEGLSVLPRGTVADKRIALVNLMPVKQDTELDFMRLIAASPHKVEVIPVNMASHTSRHTTTEHITRFYTPSDRLDMTRTDGAIITGAPLEGVAYEDVDFWPEISRLFDRMEQYGVEMMHVCWAAFARLYQKHGIAMRLVDRKISGVFSHRILEPNSPLMQGTVNNFKIPHSRFAALEHTDIEHIGNKIKIIAESEEAGIYMAASLHEIYITGHGEYSPLTLDGEYRRDLAKGMNPHLPEHYYEGDNPHNKPTDQWSATASRIMLNWIDMIPVKSR